MKLLSLKCSAGVLCGLLLATLFLPMYAETADPPIIIKYIFYSSVSPHGVERHECALDSHTLLPADATRLAKLLERSKILDRSTLRDFQQTEGGPGYIIDCRKGSSSAKVEWSYKYAPSRVWPLVEFLEKHSRITKKS